MAKDEQNKKPQGKPEGKGGRPDSRGDNRKAAGPKKIDAAAVAAAETGPRVPPRLQVMFNDTIRAKLVEQFQLAPAAVHA